MTKVLVTLGTYRGYGFERLIRRVLAILPAGADVVWQTGDTPTEGLGIDGREAMPERELLAAMADADVIVSHAGVGSALTAFEIGRSPILVPRRAHLGEHVDDHQVQVAGELHERGLAMTVDADELTLAHLEEAARRGVAPLADPPDFALEAAP